MKEPLLLPFLALAAGIILSHASSFPRSQGALALVAFLLLFLIARWRKIRWAIWSCGLLAAASAGSWLVKSPDHVLPSPCPQVMTQHERWTRDEMLTRFASLTTVWQRHHNSGGLA